MTTALYTNDEVDTGWAAEGADLERYETEAEATAAFQRGYSDAKISGWQEASFGDCWVKCYTAPDFDAEGYAEIDGIKCNVQHPGTHPGGKAWWCTPVDAVMVPVLEMDEDAA